MSNRVDHVAEARRIQTAARKVVRIASEEGALAPHMTAVIMLDDARLEAQLALVEQQRIANKIALSQATNADGSRIAPWALTHPVDEWGVAVNDDIRAGLGL